MAAELRMKLEAMVSAAQFLANQCDELQAGLDAITRDWRELSSTWTGVAASAFDPPWDEWHWGAKTVTAILQECSDLLMRSAALMAENDGTYRGDAAIINYNPNTGLAVIQKPNGEFVSGWRLISQQATNVLLEGSLR